MEPKSHPAEAPHPARPARGMALLTAVRLLWRHNLHRRWIIAALLCALAAACVSEALVEGWLEKPENELRDLISRRGRPAPTDPRLLYLAIDQESKSIAKLDLETLFAQIPRDSPDYHALELMTEEFPWSREVHALVLEKLFAAGAIAVGFDVLFTTPRGGDEALQSAVERHAGRVVLASNFGERDQGPGGTSAYDQPIPEVLPRTEDPGRSIGFVNYFADSDAVVRHAVFATSERERRGRLPLPGEEPLRSFAARLALIAGEGARVPVDSRPRRLRFAGGPTEGFPPVSLYQLFVPDYWRDNLQNGAVFRGRIVVIGAYGNWAQDEHRTPYKLPMPGPEVHLNALNALLQNGFIEDAPGWWQPLSIGLAAMAALFLRRTLPALRLLPIVGLGALLLAAAWFSFHGLDRSLPVMAALATLLLGSGAGLAYDFSIEVAERARTRRTLERYVSRDVVHQIMDNPAEYQETIGGVWRPVTVLFSDVRDFTSLTEDANAQTLVRQLNEYFSAMVECVFRNKGSLDKFIGDAVMAVWGNTSASQGPQRDACNAVRCALEMREALARLNAKWRDEGRPEFLIGIGLNQGEAIVGDLGSPQKTEFTAIGDAVNLASRMEGLTKPYGVELLVSENVARLVEDEFLLQDADLVRVKGKKKAVEIYAVLGRKSPELIALEMDGGLRSYVDGLAAFRAGELDKSWELMVDASERRPHDPLPAHYRARLERARGGDVSASWTGATVMKEK